MTNPYPLPRYIRQTDILVGDGGAAYGPFDGFQIFDVEDVEVWTKPEGAAAFAQAAATAAKVSGLSFDYFTINVPGGIAATTQFVVRPARLHERTAGAMSRARIDPSALEKELSKQDTVLQELTRDVGRSMVADFGEQQFTIDGGIDDGRTLMREGNPVQGKDLGGFLADLWFFFRAHVVDLLLSALF